MSLVDIVADQAAEVEMAVVARMASAVIGVAVVVAVDIAAVVVVGVPTMIDRISPCCNNLRR
jgi:hypothetical protein